MEHGGNNGDAKQPENDERTNADDPYPAAAKAVEEADVLLFITGAGFSADSGLAVYKDIAEIPPYQARGLTYKDICQPTWLDAEPDLFYGFWGACFNDYRATLPHKGYQIMGRWRDERFAHSKCANSIRERIRQRRGGERRKCCSFSEAPGQPGGEPYRVEGEAGAFFVFTSNVDAHAHDHFHPCEVRECHGNTELWQCSEPESCSEILWRAPKVHWFDVELKRMTARRPDSVIDRQDTAKYEKEHGVDPKQVTVEDESEEQHSPRVGHVKRQERAKMLCHWPPPSGAAGKLTSASFEGPGYPNRPHCPKCSRPARPAILMFGDSSWVDNEAQDRRFLHWVAATEEEATERKKTQEEGKEGAAVLSICVVEIGCGKNVNTCRETTRMLTKKFQLAGADCTVVRINRDHPGRDEPHHESVHFIGIQGGGLESLERINRERHAKGKA